MQPDPAVDFVDRLLAAVGEVVVYSLRGLFKGQALDAWNDR
jgi:hypothetical protein